MFSLPSDIESILFNNKNNNSYVTAWNNLGDAREKRGEWAEAAKADASTLALDPANAVARARAEAVRARAGASSSSNSSSS